MSLTKTSSLLRQLAARRVPLTLSTCAKTTCPPTSCVPSWSRALSTTSRCVKQRQQRVTSCRASPLLHTPKIKSPCCQLHTSPATNSEHRSSLSPIPMFKNLFMTFQLNHLSGITDFDKNVFLDNAVSAFALIQGSIINGDEEALRRFKPVMDDEVFRRMWNSLQKHKILASQAGWNEADDDQQLPEDGGNLDDAETTQEGDGTSPGPTYEVTVLGAQITDVFGSVSQNDVTIGLLVELLYETNEPNPDDSAPRTVRWAFESLLAERHPDGGRREGLSELDWKLIPFPFQPNSP
eukprot:m.111333 g.111333  ORF g.111333 m.111333 type:complete len:294 (-) comp13443_c0_seq1:36-917(-)